MVGRQTLDLVVKVRVLLPQPKSLKLKKIKRIAKKILNFLYKIQLNLS